MNLLRKVIFKREAQSLQKLVLSLCGYLSFMPAKGFVRGVTDENYFLIKEKINRLHEKFITINFETGEAVPYYILFKLYQIIQFYNLSEFSNALLFINDIQKNLSLNDKYLPSSTRKWIHIYVKLISNQIENAIWFKDIENIYRDFNSLKNDKENIIEQCHEQYNAHEVNSDEHLKISRVHLDNYIQLTQLNIQEEEGHILSKEEKQHGKYLLQIMEILYEKSLKDIEHDILLKSAILLEIIKLQYYLGENKKNVFDNMVKYCSYHIKLNNFDPIGYIIGDYNSPILNEYLPISFQISFKNYLKGFYLEIKVNESYQVFFNLKQIDKFCANSLEERLKVTEI